jgi:hypothetical protein
MGELGNLNKSLDLFHLYYSSLFIFLTVFQHLRLTSFSQDQAERRFYLLKTIYLIFWGGLTAANRLVLMEIRQFGFFLSKEMYFKT